MFNFSNCTHSQKPDPERRWPEGTVCTSPDGQKFENFDSNTEMPEGTVCAVPCDVPYHAHDHGSFGYWEASLTCQCDYNGCSFGTEKIADCRLEVK